MKLKNINITQLLKKYAIRPTKGLGQNFLIDDSALKKIVAAADVSSNDVVLEIGPGLGSLTRYLAAAAKSVVAVEIDKALLGPFAEVVKPFGNIKIINRDILKVDLAELFGVKNYLVVANIPYYITSALLRHLLESKSNPSRIVLTVQKEVAMRICEKPGNMSLLALSVQVFGEPSIVAKIPAGAFYPAPNVDSAVVRIDLFDKPKIEKEELDLFFKIIKAGFSQKRKMLRNTLSSGMSWGKEKTEKLLKDVDIDPSRRAQTLSMDEWGEIVKSVKQ
ncbi:MAG: 16S rRNA (adenine(1518)-N(6)/adenine(1519)-N(6))-dimethyltransferase RsmA [Chloroflexi bacterium]|jgi:16S rRNA (adenine1518-N6/adenine1519-N6)-dimethyltransferase|nr:16S rRNA (adenine(1518)-N(6)/adenine(1519)-N(6))-dimethyltransferase RsmA [Chloroflexota bacterium]MBT4003310.1 16S rRNA (adenine(1518)-N(6)/adenine(1519)-N(6))-dimethyltransferase RsmA [Chloroflexota bacterium]MBT4305854.1 16S rRNA (adenine(1518)-N(6)/adenine(1519)-N(6))-dimethyltransferase RsmA [Chloroflexota bacterium]MBT4533679.1 16S rRNA (adenine(1518)-N(6)/adenine(1519)-N(6))-dimethyltransferase RsmA [Chloroflexota bacterium]MBT4681678.1 16S rRNA (adenine(1518)-N(6)/adenine(1519)-N(6))